MPIYEYRCECGNETQTFSHTFTPQEPACGDCEKTMRRTVSVPAGLLSGRGVNSLPPVPQSWNGIGRGSKEATTHWRREIDRRTKEYGADAPPTRGEASLTCAPHTEGPHASHLHSAPVAPATPPAGARTSTTTVTTTPGKEAK